MLDLILLKSCCMPLRERKKQSWKERIFISLQYLLVHHLLLDIISSLCCVSVLRLTTAQRKNQCKHFLQQVQYGVGGGKEGGGKYRASRIVYLESYISIERQRLQSSGLATTPRDQPNKCNGIIRACQLCTHRFNKLQMGPSGHNPSHLLSLDSRWTL